MHQTTVERVELSESMPEIELTVPVSKVSNIGVDELVKVIKNEEVGAALQVLLNFLADSVADRVMARMGYTPEAASPRLQIVRTPSPARTVGGKRQLSEESKRRISESQKARWATRPRTLSEEAKKKISESQKTRWAATRTGGATPREESSPSEADRQTPHNTPPVVDEAITDVVVSSQPILAVQDGYKGDPFYISEDGYYIGDDGFVVPKNCDEFLDRFPKYIETWVRRRLNGQGIEEDIEDWRQELIIHMKYLPATSKHRELGKDDVFQTFNPFSTYGASERRWRHYVNMCLTNKFNTIHGKKMKNPVCRVGNLTIVPAIPDLENGYINGNYKGEVSDEYVYSKSEFLSTATNREEKNKLDISFASRFMQYVSDEDPDVFPVLEAVYVAGSSTDTVKEFCKTCKRLATTVERSEGLHEGHEVGMTQKEFNRARNRIKQLGALFMKNNHSKKKGLSDESDED